MRVFYDSIGRNDLMTAKSNTAPLSLIEKAGYGAGDMASNFYNTIFNVYLLKYYVDVWGIGLRKFAKNLGII